MFHTFVFKVEYCVMNFTDDVIQKLLVLRQFEPKLKRHALIIIEEHALELKTTTVAADQVKPTLVYVFAN